MVALSRSQGRGGFPNSVRPERDNRNDMIGQAMFFIASMPEIAMNNASTKVHSLPPPRTAFSNSFISPNLM
jgi:hypothetical protein